MKALGIINEEKDIDFVDSLMQSAFNSDKNAAWVNQNREYDLVCSICAYTPPERVPSHCDRCLKLQKHTEF